MLQLSNKMPRRGYEPPEAGTIQEIVQMDNSRCGTTAGYWWHYNHKEEICLPCKEARRKNQRDNHKYKSLALVNPTNSTFDKRCGTNSGHQAHRKRNELSCEPCHNAYLEYHRKRYAKNPDKIKKQQLNWKLKNSKKYEINKKNYYAKN